MRQNEKKTACAAALAEAMKQRLREVGYESDLALSKKLAAFERAASKNVRRVPALLLTGVPGAGKTYLGCSFAQAVGAKELFVQMTADKDVKSVLVEDIDIASVIRGDAEHATAKGLLRQACDLSRKGKVVVVLDEWDKTPSSADSFLLDFLNSGRLAVNSSVDEVVPGNVWVILTSNGRRDFPEEFMRRVRALTLSKMSREAFLAELGLPQEHYLGSVYDAYPNFVLAQARDYLRDLGEDREAFDADLLSQYIPTLEPMDFEEVHEDLGEEEDSALAEVLEEFDSERGFRFDLPYSEYFTVLHSAFKDEIILEENYVVPVTAGALFYLKEQYPDATLDNYPSEPVLAVAGEYLADVARVGDHVLARFKKEDPEANDTCAFGRAISGYFVAQMKKRDWETALGLSLIPAEEEDEDDYY